MIPPRHQHPASSLRLHTFQSEHRRAQPRPRNCARSSSPLPRLARSSSAIRPLPRNLTPSAHVAIPKLSEIAPQSPHSAARIRALSARAFFRPLLGTSMTLPILFTRGTSTHLFTVARDHRRVRHRPSPPKMQAELHDLARERRQQPHEFALGRTPLTRLHDRPLAVVRRLGAPPHSER